MWVFQIFRIVWNNLFAVQVPIFGGITFGGILIIIFIGTALATYLSMFIHRGE